jgi:putative ABC transport system ATP-binding protein
MARALSPARPGPASRPSRDTGQAARPDSDTSHAVALHGVTKVYRPARRTVTALRGVHLTFPRGSCNEVMGASGSGKTTLLQCAAGLDRPTSGTVRLAGRRCRRHEIRDALGAVGLADRAGWWPRWP